MARLSTYMTSLYYESTTSVELNIVSFIALTIVVYVNPGED